MCVVLDGPRSRSHRGFLLVKHRLVATHFRPAGGVQFPQESTSQSKRQAEVSSGRVRGQGYLIRYGGAA